MRKARDTGHAGAHHAAHVLRLADQPVQVALAVSKDEASRMLQAVEQEQVHVFYTRIPTEFGLLGDEGQTGAMKRHFALFGRGAAH
ncbi:hypothetical protein [Paraburkholderia ferrariae]|uniref:hypothetical protein n=1 Tax=Paraburkholderia ferrariae TaxID=386056 RepID=UPI000694FF71|nr:hypothetical protein [Paraburkholderia ferrariae]